MIFLERQQSFLYLIVFLLHINITSAIHWNSIFFWSEALWVIGQILISYPHGIDCKMWSCSLGDTKIWSGPFSDSRIWSYVYYKWQQDITILLFMNAACLHNSLQISCPLHINCAACAADGLWTNGGRFRFCLRPSREHSNSIWTTVCGSLLLLNLHTVDVILFVALFHLMLQLLLHMYSWLLFCFLLLVNVTFCYLSSVDIILFVTFSASGGSTDFCNICLR